MTFLQQTKIEPGFVEPYTVEVSNIRTARRHQRNHLFLLRLCLLSHRYHHVAALLSLMLNYIHRPPRPGYYQHFSPHSHDALSLFSPNSHGFIHAAALEVASYFAASKVLSAGATAGAISRLFSMAASSRCYPFPMPPPVLLRTLWAGCLSHLCSGDLQRADEQLRNASEHQTFRHAPLVHGLRGLLSLMGLLELPLSPADTIAALADAARLSPWPHRDAFVTAQVALLTSPALTASPPAASPVVALHQLVRRELANRRCGTTLLSRLLHYLLGALSHDLSNEGGLNDDGDFDDADLSRGQLNDDEGGEDLDEDWHRRRLRELAPRVAFQLLSRDPASLLALKALLDGLPLLRLLPAESFWLAFECIRNALDHHPQEPSVWNRLLALLNGFETSFFDGSSLHSARRSLLRRWLAFRHAWLDLHFARLQVQQDPLSGLKAVVFANLRPLLAWNK